MFKSSNLLLKWTTTCLFALVIASCGPRNKDGDTLYSFDDGSTETPDAPPVPTGEKLSVASFFVAADQNSQLFLFNYVMAPKWISYEYVINFTTKQLIAKRASVIVPDVQFGCDDQTGSNCDDFFLTNLPDDGGTIAFKKKHFEITQIETGVITNPVAYKVLWPTLKSESASSYYVLSEATSTIAYFHLDTPGARLLNSMALPGSLALPDSFYRSNCQIEKLSEDSYKEACKYTNKTNDEETTRSWLIKLNL